LVEATIEGGGISTVDPASCYDTASGELLQNVYDTLVFYDGEHVDRFIPQLAESWIVQNITGTSNPETGLEWYYRYVFKIRQGVPFHNATFGNLTAEDVEYCFERSMVLDMDGGPQWMFFEPLLNGATATYVDNRAYDPENNIGDRILVGKMIDHAVESNGTHVWFNLAFLGVYPQLMQILSEPWSSIYSKAWANSLNRPTMWSGEWGDYTGWWVYHNPDTPPLDYPTPALVGTGPFVFIRIDNLGKEWVADRFVDYWRGWPLNWPAYAGSRPAGFVDRFRVTWAYDFPTRSQMFLNGDIDICAVPRQYFGQILNQPGIRCMYPLPSLGVDALLYQFNIDATSPYGPILPAGTFNESGVPTDFFGNTTWGVHVRKAFASVIDYDLYISSVFLGEAVHPATAVIPALPYFDATVKGYSYNLSRAEEELKQVPGLWDTGFSLKLLYNVGSLPRLTLPELIANKINSLNPKFHAQAVGLDWASYLAASRTGQLPVFAAGWLADYPDPHNFAYPYYYTYGNFAARAHYSNPTMDALIDEGIRTPDGPARAQIYSQIQQLAVDDCPCVPLATPIYRRFERNWVCGWYCNPAYSGIYAANVWNWYYVPQALNETAFPPTSDCLSFDINYDGKVNMSDIGVVAASFGAEYGPPMHARWIFRCDLNNDRKINMQDIGMVARYFGKTAVAWIPPP
jgi:peptide/nickel transport system substrate-binding protein